MKRISEDFDVCSVALQTPSAFALMNWDRLCRKTGRKASLLVGYEYAGRAAAIYNSLL